MVNINEDQTYVNIKTTDPTSIDFYKERIQYVWGAYLRGRTAIPLSFIDRFDMLRAYGTGNQNEDQYIDKLGTVVQTETQDGFGVIDTLGDEINSREAKRKGLGHLNFEILSPAMKIRNTIHGMLNDADYNIYAETVDHKSIEDKEFEKWKLWTEAQNGEWQNEFYKKAGIPMGEEIPYIPKSLQELESYEAAQGFKTNVESIMEKLIKSSLDNSDWNGRLKERLINDAIDYNLVCTKEYFNEETRKFETKYIYPRSLVAQYTRSKEYDNTDWAGHWELVTGSFLKQKLLAEGHSDEEVYAILKQAWGNRNNEISIRYTDSYSEVNLDTISDYDNLKFIVFEVEFVDVEMYDSVRFKGRYNETYRRVEPNEEIKSLTPRDKRRGLEQEIKKTRLRKLYQGTWLVGSDTIFDWGESEFMYRPQANIVRHNYNIAQGDGRSITGELMPIYDQIQLGWLKYQDNMAKAIPDSYAIDMKQLNNLKDGKNGADPMSLIQFWLNKRILPHSQSLSGRYEGGNPLPVTKIEGTVLAGVAEGIQLITTNLQLIEQMTGLSAMAMGATPAQGQAVRTTEIAVEATQIVLKPIISQILRLKKRSADTLVKRIMLAVKHVPSIAASYKTIIGEADLRLLKTDITEMTLFALNFVPKPSGEIKANFVNIVNLAIQNGRDGAAEGIDVKTGMMMLQDLEDGNNLRGLEMKLGYEIEKRNERLQYERDRAIQLEGEQNQALAQQKAQAQSQLMQQEIDGKIAIEQARVQGNLIEEKAKIPNKYMEMLQQENLRTHNGK